VSFISVTDIINFQPLQAIVGQEYKLEGTVVPTNATNKIIVWSLVEGGASISIKPDGAYIKPNFTGTITVRAMIINGKEA